MKPSGTVSLASAGIVAMVALAGCTGTTDSGTDAATDLAVVSDSPGNYSLTWQGHGEATAFAATSASSPAADGDEVARGDVESATVNDLDPNLRWYFEVQGTDGAGVIAATRQFVLDGTENVRDLGGYATDDGRSVAWGKVFRADDLSELTPAAVEKMETADVQTVVDFRGVDEIGEDGVAPVSDGIEVINLPVLDETTQALAEALTGVMQGADPAVVDEMLGGGESQRIKDESFVAQLEQPETMAGYGETLRLIADSPGAVMYHCTAGKDRTGMMSALLLGLLGVPDETIVEDFVLSNEYLSDHYSQTYAFLESQGVDVELIRPLTEQSASNIQPVLDAVQNQYGGWDSFATDVLNLDSATIDRLRDSVLV